MSEFVDSTAGNLSRREVLTGIATTAALGRLPLPEPKPDEIGPFRSMEDLYELDRFGDPAPTSEIVASWKTLPPIPSPTWTAVKGDWRFKLGSPSEGLSVDLARMPQPPAPVTLPHRLLEADTPFWYQARLELPDHSALSINADDGAHLWVDGKRIVQTDGVFRLEKIGAGPHEVVVRVLNKAVYGGLSNLSTVSLSEYDRLSAQGELRRRLDRNIRKIRLLIEPPARSLDAARKALSEPNEENVLALEKSLSAFPMVTIAPGIHADGPRQVVVAWETDVPAKPQVSYRTENGPLRKAKVLVDGTFYRATLADLNPGETVTYRIEGQPTRKFRMLPSKGDFTFTVWGDPHIGFERFRQNTAALVREPAAFTVGVGDQVVDAFQKEPWETFFEIGAPLFASTPAFFMGGNHDYDGCFEDLVSPHHNRYARLDGKPWHAWSAGNARFIALDPNVQFPTGISEGSEQHRWFLDELASPAWQAARWRFLFIHQPPFSQGWTDYEGDLPIRALLEPLIPRCKIDFVVSGHTHDYERLTRTYGDHRCTFLIVGGAGGGLEDGPLTPQPVMETVQRRHHYGRFLVREDSVKFECVATDALILDSFQVQR